MKSYLLRVTMLINFLSLIDTQILFSKKEESQKLALPHKCINAEGEYGQCIPLEKCDKLVSIFQQLSFSHEIREVLRSNRCNTASRILYVCCPQVKKNLLPRAPSCGKVISDKIYGGEATAIDEYPWTARLEYTRRGYKNIYLCGGTLINENYVLTAAHCVIGKGVPNNWRLSGVRLGEWNTSSIHDCDIDDCAPPTQDIPIEKIIPHNGFNPSSTLFMNDIALLRLSKRVIYSSWIQPVCLPNANYLRNTDFDRLGMDVVGWGKTEDGKSSDIKLKARVFGYSLSTCSKIYSPYGFIIGYTQICAGGKVGIDSCSGDSGGPLIGLDSRGRIPYNFLAGVVSYGPSPCGIGGFPGIYTKVGSYIDWIESKIAP